jgi:hypothetical protein
VVDWPPGLTVPETTAELLVTLLAALVVAVGAAAAPACWASAAATARTAGKTNDDRFISSSVPKRSNILMHRRRA